MTFDGWKVTEIPTAHTHDWLLNRHYAKAVPPISMAFGLFEQNTWRGVCTFGPPARMFNNGYGLFGNTLVVPTFELNRLCVSDIPENGLSWFVGQVLKLLTGPMALVSYADTNWGHHGYIYQATNWLYCGMTSDRAKYIDKETGRAVHARTVVSQVGTKSHESEKVQERFRIEHQEGKHRYVYFVGSRTDKRRMRKALAYEVLPYPKGENTTYQTGTVLAERSNIGKLLGR